MNTDRTQYWCSGCGEPLGEDEPNHQHSKTTLQPHLTAREQHRLACGTCGKRLRDHIEGVTGHAFVRTFAPDPAPLDVERLARALRTQDREQEADFNAHDRAYTWERKAAAIAREYAALEEPE